MKLGRSFATWLTTITKALTAGSGAASAVLVAAAQKPGGPGLADVELAVGAFVVVGFLAWLFPNWTA